MIKDMVGFYGGSFDPFTNGHLAIVKKASKCFKKVVIGIGSNIEKSGRIDKEKMRLAIEETIKEERLDNVEVITYSNLTVDKAKEIGATLLIRGLRNGTDYQYEENVAEMNERISGLDTCYFRAGDLGYLSSSLVMELHNFDKDISEYVPKAVYKLLKELN